MLVSEFVRKLNLGVIVKHGVVTDDKTAPGALALRERLVREHTATVDKGDFLVGVKPVSFISGDRLDVLWSVSALRRGEGGKLFSVELEHLTEREREATSEVKASLEQMEANDRDVSRVFGELGMRCYYPSGSEE